MLAYWWLPVITIMSTLAGVFSCYLNADKNTKWIFYLWLLNAIPLWALVARNSKSVLFDGLIYDTVMVLAYTITVIYFTSKDHGLSIAQWVSLFVTLGGLLAFKLCE